MTPLFLRLTLKSGAVTILVNASTISMLKPNPNGGTIVYTVGDDEGLYVAEQFEAITKKLDVQGVS